MGRTVHLFGQSFDGEKASLEKTVQAKRLLETPLSKRDQHWIKQFIHLLPFIYLDLDENEVQLQDDGYPYIKAIGCSSSESFSIVENLDLFLENGFGLFIETKQVDWFLTFGDLLSYYLNKEFYVDEDHYFDDMDDSGQLENEEDMLIGQPAEEILPNFARKHLREFLKHVGINNPKTALLIQKQNGKVLKNLLFNCAPSNFTNQNEYQEVLKSIAWFLPKHYSFLAIDEKELGNHLVSL
ncbi:MAG TPA: hypothetical protein H9853_02380 [Candidatus Sphingobacterium stercoripullorum]|uniref:Uncharacterized protein n=1 Tax=Candidatus Sphingobacterium stercoripullorum TaxID=2838759 RepID=A0A9D1W7X4_9SPHI|nr:hypothetical protein [Candidatus Sphingobacterium stercoripullorum]